ncbi:hypothetical protein MBRA1_002789 [Malassezia brasiliensis]|uniref:CTLH domain-containing protein n=1 Tax=Malassezia brasiliensis TaxID=1821822 RepID=A0AAF0DU47_9BASI|nr:hypothetical protein MBRA1_002789 [Malassezia brasiliensis]
MVSRDAWEARLAQVPVSKRDLDRLVMDYLVVQGYKSAAETFGEETLVVPEMEMAEMDARIVARDALLRGDVASATELVNDLNPEILDTSPSLFFHLQQLRMIELLRAGDIDAALSFAAEHLAPLGEEHPHLLHELEETMSLFVYDMQTPQASVPPHTALLYSPAYRQDVADELNAAILASQSYNASAKLAQLLQILSSGERLLGPSGPGKTEFPHLDIPALLARSELGEVEESMTDDTKSALGDNDAVNNDTAGYAYLENFALNIFLGADNEDREGRATKYFLELLNVQTKIKYAKWKAAQISKALREGKKPAPGPAVSEEESVLAQLIPPQETRVHDAQDAPATPAGQHCDTAPKDAEAPIVAPGAREQALPKRSMPSTLPAVLGEETRAEARSFPSAPSTDTAQVSSAPAPPSTDAANLSSTSSSENQLPSVPDEGGAPVAPVQLIAATKASSTPPTEAVYMTPSAPPPPTTDARLSVTEIAKVQKLSRWASSALDYEDVETARTHLQDALRILDSARSPPT